MARLHEYQGKAILAENGFKIPRGRGASTADEAVAVAKELLDQKGSEVVVKIQAWTTGRAGASLFHKQPPDRAPLLAHDRIVQPRPRWGCPSYCSKH